MGLIARLVEFLRVGHLQHVAILFIFSVVMPQPSVAIKGAACQFNSSVEPWDAMNGAFLAPSHPDAIPASVARVTIRNAANEPRPGVTVELVVHGADLSLCDDSVLDGVTDDAGEVELVFAGGGCASDVPLGVLIRADGETIRAYDQTKSPDFDGSAASGSVDISDLLEFKRGFLDGVGTCHDYDNDGTVGLSDLLLFGPAFTRALHCVD